MVLSRTEGCQASVASAVTLAADLLSVLEGVVGAGLVAVLDVFVGGAKLVAALARGGGGLVTVLFEYGLRGLDAAW